MSEPRKPVWFARESERAMLRDLFQRSSATHRQVSREATERWPKLTKHALRQMNDWWDDRVKELLTRSEPE